MRSFDDTPEKRRLRGMRILWAREILQPNRYEFARTLGVDPSTIRNIENGKANPGPQLLHWICHSLRISLDYIVDGTLNGVDPHLAYELGERHRGELFPQRVATPTGKRRTSDPQDQDHTSATVVGAQHQQ
jgi:transcriptional regulator with XRE-family HTH domain